MILAIRLFLAILLSTILITNISCSSADRNTGDDVQAGDVGSNEDLEDLEDLGDEGSEGDDFGDEADAGDEGDFGDEDDFADQGGEEGDDLSELEDELEPLEESEVAAGEGDELEELEEPLEEPLEEGQETQGGAIVEGERLVSPGETVEIQNIKYRSNDRGGTVIIDATGPMTFQTRNNAQTNQVVVDIENARLPEKLKRPYIMKEFDGLIGAINAYQSPGASTARIVIQLKGPGGLAIQQEGNSLVVIPSTEPGVQVAESQVSDDLEDELEDPVAAGEPDLSDDIDDDLIDDPVLAEEGEEMEVAEFEDDLEPQPVDMTDEEVNSKQFDTKAAAQDEKILGARTLDEYLIGSTKFYGRKMSIQVKDADVRDVLNFIAEEAGINMVISDDVGGQISLKLRKVPWDQALVTVMRARGLGYIRQGNVIRISTLGTLQNESQTAKNILDAQKELIPQKVKVIPVSYAQLADVVKQIGPFLTQGKGSAGADLRTSSLIVTDTDETIKKIEKLIKSLDKPPEQVLIEGKVVEATQAFSRSIGINWSFNGSPVTLSNTGGANGGPVELTSSLSINPISSSASTVAGLSLNVGTLDFLGDINAQLSLAENDSTAKILSSPRIITLNKELAEIKQSGEIITLNRTVDENGNVATTVNRSPVILELKVTPQITAAGSVIMEVEVKRAFAGPVEDQASLARALNTREAKTKVLVDNGQTAVIGGVYQSDMTVGETGVPLLKDIPVLGWLFKRKDYDKVKNELLIFLTPRILTGNQGTANETKGF